jgi:outer membrane protein assembly factor BamD
MIKKFLAIIFVSILIAGCSSLKNTANMTPKEYLDYAMQLYNDGDYTDALNEFQAIVLQYPGDAVADGAEYYLGMTQYKKEQYILAAYEFSKLIKNMPASDFVPKAQFMLAQCYYELSPDFSLDQAYTKKAIQEFQAFIDYYPTNEKVQDAETKIQELNNKLAHKEFHSAEIYEKMDYYDAALIYYNDVIDTYHDTKYAAMASYNKIYVLMEMNKNDEALTAADNFLEKYPNDDDAPHVRKLKASLENKLSSSE